MRIALHRFYGTGFLPLLRVLVLVTGALFFGGGCPSDADLQHRPVTPKYLSVTSITDRILQLEWSREAYFSETSFEIDRADSTMVFRWIGSTRTGVGTYIDTALHPERIYYYRVRAVMDSLITPYSGTIAVGYGQSMSVNRTINAVKKVSGLAVTKNGAYLVSAYNDGAFDIWNTATWNGVRVSAQSGGSNRTFALSSDSKYLLLLDRNTLEVRSLSDGSPYRSMSKDSLLMADVTALADGYTAVTANEKGKLWIVNSTAGAFIRELDSLSIGYGSITASDTRFASCTRYSTLIWDIDSWTVQRRIYGQFYDPRLSPNGSLLAMRVAADPLVSVIADASNGTVLWSYPFPFNAREFSPNSAVFVVAAGNVLKVIETTGGRVTQSRIAHSDFITGIGFFPDGTTFATGCYDGTIKIWSLALTDQWHVL